MRDCCSPRTQERGGGRLRAGGRLALVHSEHVASLAGDACVHVAVEQIRVPETVRAFDRHTCQARAGSIALQKLPHTRGHLHAPWQTRAPVRGRARDGC
jgi:hypothetical protein